jgi:hypothetical protein
MTMASKLEDDANISDSSVLCKKILSADRKIQSIEMVNKKGRSVELVTRNNTVILPSHKKEIFHMSEILQESMRREYDDELGKVNYSYVSRKKVSIFSFRIGENMLIVTSFVLVNPDAIAKKIISLIDQNTVFT